MSYKDTLALYDELIAGGCSEAQARAQSKQLGGLSDHFGTAIDDIHKILAKIEKDLFWMRLVGGAMTIAFVSNFFK